MRQSNFSIVCGIELGYAGAVVAIRIPSSGADTNCAVCFAIYFLKFFEDSGRLLAPPTRNAAHRGRHFFRRQTGCALAVIAVTEFRYEWIGERVNFDGVPAFEHFADGRIGLNSPVDDAAQNVTL